jgi:hypothetical protein
MPILAIIQAAIALAPSLVSAYQVISGALQPAGAAPVPAPEIVTAAVAEIEAAASIEPALVGLAPMVTKAVSGVAFTDTDLATLREINDAIDAAVEKAAANVVQQGTTAI